MLYQALEPVAQHYFGGLGWLLSRLFSTDPRCGGTVGYCPCVLVRSFVRLWEFGASIGLRFHSPGPLSNQSKTARDELHRVMCLSAGGAQGGDVLVTSVFLVVTITRWVTCFLDVTPREFHTSPIAVVGKNKSTKLCVGSLINEF